jgi:TolB-like protein
MPKKIFGTMSLCMIFWLLALPATWGGQVVTPETRQWAREAVSIEKSMQAVTTGHTLAVLYFRNRSGDVNLDPLQKGFSVMLMTDLAKIKTIQLVERVKLQALAEEIGLGRSGIVEPGTAPRVGRLLGARYLIGGEFFKEELEKLRLRSDLLNVPEEKIFDQPQVLDTLGRLFALEKEMLFKIIEALKIEIPPARKKLLMEPMSTSYPALVYFFRGIDKSDQGDYEAAAMFYKKALAEDAKLHLADVNMKELNQLGLWRPVKRTAGLLKSLQSRTSLTDRLTAEYPTARLNKPKKVLSVQIEGYLDTPAESPTGSPSEQLFYTKPPPDYPEYSYPVVPVTADYVVRQPGPDGTPATYYGISTGDNQGEYLGGSYSEMEW